MPKGKKATTEIKTEKIVDNRAKLIFNSFISNEIPKEIEINDETVTYTVKKLISPSEFSEFVVDVINNMFVDDGYNPTLKKLFIRINTIKYYTDLSLDELTLNELNDLCYSDFYYGVMDSISFDQYQDIELTINNYEEYFKQINYRHTPSNSDYVMNNVSELVDLIKDFITGLFQNADKFNSENLEKLAPQLIAMKNGFNQEDFVKLVLDKMKSEEDGKVINIKKTKGGQLKLDI